MQVNWAILLEFRDQELEFQSRSLNFEAYPCPSASGPVFSIFRKPAIPWPSWTLRRQDVRCVGESKRTLNRFCPGLFTVQLKVSMQVKAKNTF